MAHAKHIMARRSQLLSTYGVGSLFPSENASYLMVGLHLWDSDSLPVIGEPRLVRQLRVRELKSPPATPESQKFSARRKSGVPVTRFPLTLQCPSCSAIGTPHQLRSSAADPKCGLCGKSRELMPSRFVTACEASHLSEFPYFEWVHPGSDLKVFDWMNREYPALDPRVAPPDAHVLRLVSRGRTSALSDLVVKCSCGRFRDLGSAFSEDAMKKYACRGERPWLGREYRQKDCSYSRRTVQRGASNVWFAASESAISIPPHSGKLTALVDQERRNLRNLSQDQLRAAAETGISEALSMILAGRGLELSVQELAGYSLEALYADSVPALSEEEFRYEEYKAIMEGAPDEPDSQFVSEKVQVAEELGTWLHSVRRISRLREVRALSGFTRLTASEQAAVGDGVRAPIAALRPEDHPDSWLPAVELLGEGLFVALDHSRLEKWALTALPTQRQRQLQANARGAADRAHSIAAGENPGQRAFSADEVDIVKVAVHTLAHVLIDQLALEAGYPASSLRERLFVGNGMAGILVYTASSDSAGSLGGVSSMADPSRLSAALREAEERLGWCSADPVCVESMGNGSDGSNLAACHNCVLLPETSCEEFNSGLDRGVLFGTPDAPNAGLLSWLRANPVQAPVVNPQLPARGDESAPAPVLKNGWSVLWEQHEPLRRLIEILAEEFIAPPASGEELGDSQTPVDLVWAERRVAAGAAIPSELVDELEAAGWIVVRVGEGDDPDDLAGTIIDSV